MEKMGINGLGAALTLHNLGLHNAYYIRGGGGGVYTV